MPDNSTNARADARAFITRAKLASAPRLKAGGGVALAVVGEGTGGGGGRARASQTRGIMELSRSASGVAISRDDFS